MWTQERESAPYQASLEAQYRACQQETRKMLRENTAVQAYRQAPETQIHHHPRDCTDTLGVLTDTETVLRNGLLSYQTARCRGSQFSIAGPKIEEPTPWSVYSESPLAVVESLGEAPSQCVPEEKRAGRALLQTTKRK